MNQVFNVQGMSCGHCVKAVTEAVRSVDPAAEVKVDLGSGRVDVVSEGSREAIVAAIRDEGYAVAV